MKKEEKTPDKGPKYGFDLVVKESSEERDGVGHSFLRSRSGFYFMPDPNFQLEEDIGRLRLFPRATSKIKKFEDRKNLERWFQRQVVKGLFAEPWILRMVEQNYKAKGRFDRSVLDGAVRAAHEAAGSSAAAVEGTRIHEMLEELDRGSPVGHLTAKDDMLRVKAYRRALKRGGVAVDERFVERVVYNPTWDAAGTLDRLVRVTEDKFVKVDGRQFFLKEGDLVVADIKTSKYDPCLFSGPSIAAQLAIYAFAAFMWAGDATMRTGDTPDGWVRHVAVDAFVGLVLWMPQDRPEVCKLRWVSLGFGRKMLDLLAEVQDVLDSRHPVVSHKKGVLALNQVKKEREEGR